MHVIPTVGKGFKYTKCARQTYHGARVRHSTLLSRCHVCANSTIVKSVFMRTCNRNRLYVGGLHAHSPYRQITLPLHCCAADPTPMSPNALLQCQFPSWYDQYAALTAESAVIPLSDEFAAFLEEDGVVVADHSDAVSCHNQPAHAVACNMQHAQHMTCPTETRNCCMHARMHTGSAVKQRLQRGGLAVASAGAAL